MLIRRAEDVTPDWLSEALLKPVAQIDVTPIGSNWASHARIRAIMADGAVERLWLKMCVGETFGPSEVHYYTRDYLGLTDAPLIRCFTAHFEPGAGYHLLLEDTSDHLDDRKALPPTLEHGLALAEGLAILQRHHWQSQPAASEEAVERYFRQIRPGVANLERALGRTLGEMFEEDAARMVERWRDPKGQTLLHGDANPTNVLTPKGKDGPVYFLDRQPFDWSLTYGLALYDLAYAIVPWWPYELRRETEEAVLRRWWEVLDDSDYRWSAAQADWDLAVAQCLHVPIEWCRESDDVERMRWLWEWQMANVTGSSAPPENGDAIEH